VIFIPVFLTTWMRRHAGSNPGCHGPHAAHGPCFVHPWARELAAESCVTSDGTKNINVMFFFCGHRVIVQIAVWWLLPCNVRRLWANAVHTCRHSAPQ